MNSFIKKNIIIELVIIYILILSSVIYLVFFANHKNEYEELLINVGSDFYENFYYKNINNDKEEKYNLLEKYKDIEIKINLNNLKKYNYEKNSRIIKKFEEKNCNNEISK